MSLTARMDLQFCVGLRSLLDRTGLFSLHIYDDVCVYNSTITRKELHIQTGLF